MKILILSFGLLLLLGCKEKPTDTDKNVLVAINDRAITLDEFNHWKELRNASLISEQKQDTLIKELVLRLALEEKALAIGIQNDPEVQRTVQSLLIARLKEELLAPKIAAIDISDAAIKEAYQAQKENHFKTPARYQAAVLWLNSRGQPPLEQRYQTRLEKVRTEFLANPAPLSEGFGQLAIKNSEHRPSQYKGGVIGWLEDSTYTDDFRNAVLAITRSLQPGSLSEIIVRREGVFLVRLLEQQATRYRDFDTVKADLRKKLTQEARKKLEADFENGALSDSKIIYYLENLPDTISKNI